MDTKSIKLKQQIIRMQLNALKKRHERQKKKEAFVRKNLKIITSLSMSGWPRTKEMKDILKWADLVYKAKMLGIYSIGTSMCDVIMQIHSLAKKINNHR